ncbi:MAG: hypothetical protein SFW36_07405 [Leptolyngbyaceae cyanobacterium bins.59]|nr:hypothetical protein [Leptolyngbyaceae cyanobacterium bins.59]
MDAAQLDRWISPKQQTEMVSRLGKRVGMTRTRAECFVRLWVYLLVKQHLAQQPSLKPPLPELTLPTGALSCTLREAAELFYSDKEQGSDRSAGMMLEKLAALGLIGKSFDGNTTRIAIQPLPELLHHPNSTASVKLILGDFDPRCDAIPVANLLAVNYNWMSRNTASVPYRIAGLLREWASQYQSGMRVLRRSDNLNPVGFYLLYPTAKESEAKFFEVASKGFHLSVMRDVDPFKMATVGDVSCISIYIRSWMIDPIYMEQYRVLFLKDVQQTLLRMQRDFPNLCDLHTMIIHPSYERLASALGFQKTNYDASQSVYWMYLALDRFLALDIDKAMVKAAQTLTNIE